MNLGDALDDFSGGGGAPGVWPGQPSTNPTWPGGQPSTNPTWPGGQPSTNPAWPGAPPAAGGGAWPGGQPAAGGGAWPGAPPAAGGGAWPGAPPAAGGGAWPGAPPAAGGGAWPGGQPAAGGGWPSPSPGPAIPAAPQQNVVVPYTQNLPHGVHDKLLITIAGVIKPKADKITVDLFADHDLAFHFNPRFNESGKKVIVRNTRINNKWGKEERDLQHFPFSEGKDFEMKIMCTNREFKVAVNNSHLLTYQHRITNLRSINRLNIYNDLRLSKVLLETMP
ncbi:galectin-3b isoform X2 [Enoplosus armatus]|uniref:galectin-3b isoform X2 n=1 Tax=Enoplosus armatus TaxID=215367 RepID=UPI00399122F5